MFAANLCPILIGIIEHFKGEKMEDTMKNLAVTEEI